MKQPRVPEYREAEGVGKYLQSLTLFLKDFCMESWRATANLQRAAGMDERAALAFVLRYVYPVGSIYMSMDEESPEKKWGGSWERIEGRLLLYTGEESGTEEQETAQKQSCLAVFIWRRTA